MGDLIVDDDPVQRRLLDDMVRGFGYEPITGHGDSHLARCSSVSCAVARMATARLDGLR